MKYRLLGRTGVRVSPLCLGTMNLGEPTPEVGVIRLIHKAIDLGINFIDNANVYHQGESERILSNALAPDKRQRIVLVSK